MFMNAIDDKCLRILIFDNHSLKVLPIQSFYGDRLEFNGKRNSR
jgi:hypothetical protein